MNEVPKKLDYGIVPSERAREGLARLGEDIANYLNGTKLNDVKTTTTKDGAIINNIYNYGYARSSAKFGFVRTVWIVGWCVFTILGVYTVIAHPEWIVEFGHWIKHIFTAI